MLRGNIREISERYYYYLVFVLLLLSLTTQIMLNDTAMDTSTVRSSPVCDGQQGCLNADGRRHCLPCNLWMWIKKRVKTRLRKKVLSLNVGTMTGKSRELAELLGRIIIYEACAQCTK